MRIDSYRFLVLLLLLASVAAAGCSNHRAKANASAARAPTPAILTADVGAEMDDQWTMAHLLLSPEVDLKAIVTTHAQVAGLTSQASARKAAEVLTRVVPDAKAAWPRVEAGSSFPLEDTKRPRESAGMELLLSISREFSPTQRLTIFVTGAATDVASAILKEPSITNRITVVAMAFNEWPSGGDGFNVRNDPAAWTVILDSDVPVVVGSFAVTRKSLKLTRAEGRELTARRGPAGAYLYAEFTDWLDRSAPLVASLVGPDTWVIWDQVVVAYVLGMTRGEDVPRPTLNSDLSFSYSASNRRITWLTEIDSDRLWADFTSKLDVAQRTK